MNAVHVYKATPRVSQMHEGAQMSPFEVLHGSDAM